MKRKNIWTLFFILVITFIFPASASAAKNFYTYTYDYWGDERESPDAYVPGIVLMGQDLGTINLREPQGMFVKENKVYIADSGNNRIIIAEKTNQGFQLYGIIESFVLEGEKSTLSYPQDVFVKENGDIYICDTNNQRVLHLDKNLNFIKQIAKPKDETIEGTSEFLVQKLVVDDANRVYVLVKNVNKGLMEFDSEGTFTGYIGANKVIANITDYIWKSISTKAQRAQMELFVPTEYNNVALDKEGFIYTTTSTLDNKDIYTGTATPIRKLNSMGTDILIRNGFHPPIGDIYWGKAGGINGPSRLIDIVPLENDSYSAIDRVRGRIFTYDSQGNLLYAFGGLGNKTGYFQYPSAIEAMGDSLLVLDYRSGTIQELLITEYGKLINQGLALYQKGRYEESAEKWEEVLKLNGNYDLAYVGIGRSLLRQGEYKKAMEYFKLKMDFKNYSKAYKFYRKQWIEENIAWIILGLVLLYILPKIKRLIVKIIMLRKTEVER
ncbi:MAG: tetratricopeptide repeat protein [Epulopiscium sp.]|nr:tetratricopeptide repeat protein [Candidatus Epulonipiscium sp.]